MMSGTRRRRRADGADDLRRLRRAEWAGDDLVRARSRIGHLCRDLLHHRPATQMPHFMNGMITVFEVSRHGPERIGRRCPGPVTWPGIFELRGSDGLDAEPQRVATCSCRAVEEGSPAPTAPARCPSSSAAPAQACPPARVPVGLEERHVPQAPYDVEILPMMSSGTSEHQRRRHPTATRLLAHARREQHARPPAAIVIGNTFSAARIGLAEAERRRSAPCEPTPHPPHHEQRQHLDATASHRRSRRWGGTVAEERSSEPRSSGRDRAAEDRDRNELSTTALLKISAAGTTRWCSSTGC